VIALLLIVLAALAPLGSVCLGVPATRAGFRPVPPMRDRSSGTAKPLRHGFLVPG
jgi:hypothetical protein